MNIRPGITFDDVMLAPKYSEIPNRNLENIDLSINLGKGIKLSIPVVSANMKSITGPEMATTIAEMGGLAILHRFVEASNSQPHWFGMWEMWKKVCNTRPELINHVGVSVGVQEDDFEIVNQLAGYAKIFCVDVAHGDHIKCVKMTEYIAKNCPDALLISGNVATKAGALRLYNAGATVIKVGIGGGSLCTTRIETGNGVPQLTALEDVYNASLNFETHTEYHQMNYPVSVVGGACGIEGTSVILSGVSFPQTTVLPSGRKFKIIADGGIRKAGDIVKALCFSDVVMLGNLLAGTDEAPGRVLYIDGKGYKEYAGSSTHKANHIEGVSALVPTKGPVKTIVNKLIEGVLSGLSYQGATNLDELKDSPEFVSVSHAGLIESHPHDVMVK
ncbi:MAG TPA: guanosine monophosphate reductase [Anaerovoracaceae bacterium]|nr:guanosine monophosphate reductase [Anaerovoracaceae bacterium]